MDLFNVSFLKALDGKGNGFVKDIYNIIQAADDLKKDSKTAYTRSLITKEEYDSINSYINIWIANLINQLSEVLKSLKTAVK
ncbi:hypothetical protein J4403_04670 [Candidatus Woesearchaeota archaeon]|nr:hypothetical protein [Candidatus Woesearchaeota archaeon]